MHPGVQLFTSPPSSSAALCEVICRSDAARGAECLAPVSRISRPATGRFFLPVAGPKLERGLTSAAGLGFFQMLWHSFSIRLIFEFLGRQLADFSASCQAKTRARADFCCGLGSFQVLWHLFSIHWQIFCQLPGQNSNEGWLLLRVRLVRHNDDR